MSRSRQLSTEEKEALARRLEAGERVAALARETGVLRKSLYPMAGRLAGDGGRGPQPQARSEAGHTVYPRTVSTPIA